MLAVSAHPLEDTVRGILRSLRRRWPVPALAVLLHLGDVVSTHVGLARGIEEASPLPAAVLAAAGEAAMYGLKFGVLAAVVLFICLLDERYPILWGAIHVTNVAVAFVVFANVAVIMAG